MSRASGSRRADCTLFNRRPPGRRTVLSSRIVLAWAASGTTVPAELGGYCEHRRMSFVLTINSGSSSIKFALFEMNGSLNRVLAGKFDRIGLSGAALKVVDPRI